jgi:hypothetical protein
MLTSYRLIGLAGGLAIAALAAAPPVFAEPVPTAGPLGVASALKFDDVKPAAWRRGAGGRHWSGRGNWGGAGPFVAGAALGVLGAAAASSYYYGYGAGYCNPYYGCGYAPDYGYAPNYGYGGAGNSAGGNFPR